MTAFLSNGLFISEILADNAGGSAFDTDGDGGANKADEFVEIQSVANTIVDLDGIQIWSAKRGLLYEFEQDDEIAALGTATVVGQYDGAEPSGFFDAGLPDNNSNFGFLEDGESDRNDTIYLLDTNTGEFVSISYGDPSNGSLPPILPPPFDTTGTTNLGDEIIESDAPNGTAFVRGADGDFTTDTTPTPGVGGVPCFGAGTLIMTQTGARPVENLQVGDRVVTADGGLQPILWVGARVLSGADLAQRPELRPFRVTSGSLGPGAPARDMILSPQHRVLVHSKVAARMFGTSEILIPVKQLAAMPGITQIDVTSVSYHHILLPAHHIVLADGAKCESLYLGKETVKALSDAAREEIMCLFPELDAAPMPPARHFAKGAKARTLAERHAQNKKALIRT